MERDPDMEVGMDVRCTTKTGHDILGEVVDVDNAYIIISAPENEPAMFFWDDLATWEEL